MKDDYKDFLHAVDDLSVVDVLSSRIELRRKGSIYEALCPFHFDKHLGSFKVNPTKNRWRCYACGVGGVAANFVAKYENLSLFQASVKLGLEFGLCTPAEAENMLQGKEIKPRPRVVRKKIPENAPRAPEHQTMVYDAFAAAAGPVSKQHLKHLLEERHVDGWLDSFFEWPDPKDNAFWTRFEAELKRRGCQSSLISAVQRVPGFAFNLYTMRPYFLSADGIGIKLHRADGQTSGLQVRVDEPEETEAKYKLFSSSWAEMNDVSRPEAMDGASAKQVIDILYPMDGNVKGAAITEGKYKGIQLTKLGYVVLSINGVDNWTLLLKDFLCIVSALGLHEVHIYFDADMTEKIGVAQAGVKLASAIGAAGFGTYFAVWKPELGKGIDDMLLAGHRQELRLRPGANMVKQLQRFIDRKRSEQAEKAS